MAVSTPPGTKLQRVTKAQLRRALRQYRSGQKSKTALEREFGIENARGKWITRAWATDLNEHTGNSVLV